MGLELIGNIKGPKGNKGDQGERGFQGLPGVNAVANDTATGGYLSTPGSQSRLALEGFEKQRVINVLNYGADPTGVASSYNAVVAAIADLTPGATLEFPKGTYRWPMGTPVVITTSRVTVTGGGTISGSIKFGTADTARHIRSRVTGLRFIFTQDYTTYPVTGYPAGSYFIGYDRCRELKIDHCDFLGAESAIRGFVHADTAVHNNAMITVEANHFNQVDYAWYVDAPPSGWTAHSDSSFVNNIVNVAFKTMVHWGAMDGGQVVGNTRFNLAYTDSANARFTEKRHSVYVGLSDWIHVHGNNLFEDGYEAISINGSKTTVIGHNAIAWCGQLEPRSAIKVVGQSGHDSTLTMSGGTGKLYTKSLLEVSGQFREVSIAGLSGRYDASNPTYKGSTLLSSVTHNRYDLTGVTGLASSSLQISDGVVGVANHHDRLPGSASVQSVRRTGSYAAQSTAFMTTTVAGVTVVAALSDPGDSQTEYGGLLVVNVKRAASSAGKNSTYILAVSGAPGAPQIATLSAQGYTTGALADDPSFTWSISQNNLRATPVGSTAGTFYFSVSTIGNVIAK